MKTAIRIAAVAAGVIILLLLSFFIKKSADELDVSTDNDIIIGVKTELPDGLTVFADADGTLPPLWKAEKDGAVIYLLGSIHACDKGMYPLDSRIKQAYDACDKVAVEHKNLDAMDFMGDGADYPSEYGDGDDLKKHLSEKQYALLTEAASKMGYELSDKKQLWKVYTELSTVSSPDDGKSADNGISAKYGIDRIFQILANQDGKEKLNIETDDEKSGYYPEMPDDVLGVLLEKLLKDSTDTNEICAYYKSGDLESIMAYTCGPGNAEDVSQETLDRMTSYMLTDRNRKMASRAMGYLADGGKVFFIAGASHFCGEEGITALLEKEGCTITKIE